MSSSHSLRPFFLTMALIGPTFVQLGLSWGFHVQQVHFQNVFNRRSFFCSIFVFLFFLVSFNISWFMVSIMASGLWRLCFSFLYCAFSSVFNSSSFGCHLLFLLNFNTYNFSFLQFFIKVMDLQNSKFLIWWGPRAFK